MDVAAVVIGACLRDSAEMGLLTVCGAADISTSLHLQQKNIDFQSFQLINLKIDPFGENCVILLLILIGQFVNRMYRPCCRAAVSDGIEYFFSTFNLSELKFS